MRRCARRTALERERVEVACAHVCCESVKTTRGGINTNPQFEKQQRSVRLVTLYAAANQRALNASSLALRSASGSFSSLAAFHLGMNTVLGPGLGARLSFATGGPGLAASLARKRRNASARGDVGWWEVIAGTASVAAGHAPLLARLGAVLEAQAVQVQTRLLRQRLQADLRRD